MDGSTNQTEAQGIMELSHDIIRSNKSRSVQANGSNITKDYYILTAITTLLIYATITTLLIYATITIILAPRPSELTRIQRHQARQRHRPPPSYKHPL